MSRLTTTLSHYWDKIQGSLFPWLGEELDPLTKKQQQLNTLIIKKNRQWIAFHSFLR